MKKYSIIQVCLLIFILLLVLAPENIRASEEYLTIEVEAARLLVDIPVGCHILQQRIDDEDSYIDRVGADKQQVEAYFKESGIVLDAIAEDDTYEIVLTMTGNKNVNYIYNMQSLSDEQVEEFAKTIEDSYANYGYELSEHQIYETEQAKYVVIHFTQQTDGKMIACDQYYTIRGNRVYNITLRCYTGEISEQLSCKMKRIVDSVTYLISAESFSYENKFVGLNFDLNKGWEQIDSNTEQMNIIAQFMHTNGLGESIQIMSADIWGNMDILHQITQPRSQIDTQHELSNSEMSSYAKYFRGVFSDYSQCMQEQHNGKWYLTNETPSTISTKNMEGSYYQRSYAMIQNGIIYIFQYGYYDGANLHEADFMNLLDHMKYEEAELLYQDEQAYQHIARMGYAMVAIGVLAVIVLVLIVFLYMNGINRKNEEIN